MAELRRQLVRQLLEIPGLSEKKWPERKDGFSTLHFDGKEFAHFHGDDEIDIRLGKASIASNGLFAPADSKHHPRRSPNSPWIEIRFSRQRDVAEIVRLVRELLNQ